MVAKSQILTNPACRGEASGEAGSRSAQKNLFMQNKPNFPDAQTNITSAITMDYVNIRLRRRRQNKANSKPIKANSKPIKPNFNLLAPRTNPIKPNFKPVQRSDSTVFTFPFLLFTYFSIRSCAPALPAISFCLSCRTWFERWFFYLCFRLYSYQRCFSLFLYFSYSLRFCNRFHRILCL